MTNRPPESQRILIVEDDPVLAAVTSSMLCPLGTVDTVESGERAVAMLGQQDWDLIVADIELPGMSGLDLVRAARVTRPLASTLILTGHGSFENAVAAIRAGTDDFMTKPVERASLVMKAKELLQAARERKLVEREVVLAIGAHPDDVEIGCGGTLLGHAARDDTVVILTLTAGERGGEVGTRAAESISAAAMIGARLFHADLTDTSVSAGGETIGTIQRVIDEVNPTIIYTHTKHDVHQDHRSVHAATLVAARRVPRIYCYQSPSTTVDFHPTRFVPIDDEIERKLAVIEAYGSQTGVRTYLEPDLMRATARYWSRFAQSTFVEPLEIARESERRREKSEAATIAVLEEAAA